MVISASGFKCPLATWETREGHVAKVQPDDRAADHFRFPAFAKHFQAFVARLDHCPRLRNPAFGEPRELR